MGLKQKLKRTLLPMPREDAARAMALREGFRSDSRLRRRFFRFRYLRLCNRYCCSLPLSAKIPGDTVFPHGLNGIFISAGAELGNRCTIFHQVTIGSNALLDSKGFGAPKLGDEVFVGAGAKIIGNVRIGNRARIGANAVVTTDVPDDATVVCGPCRIIEHEASRENRFIGFNAAKKRAKEQEKGEGSR